MDERQVKHFKFRQMRRISAGAPLPKGATGKFNLLCCANNYGMLFIGGNNCFAVCHTAMLYKVNDEDTNDRNEAVPLEKLKPVMVSLPGQPCHLGLSADELTLSVCIRESSLPCMLYDTRSFCEPHSQTPRPFAVINLADTTGSVWVSGLSWNPAQLECFAVCLSNGSVSIWENQGTSVKCLAASLNCEGSSICWSPKGKQLAVGHKDGRLSQFSQQMELKKEYPPPEALTEKHEVSGLFWISTHQFALVLTPSGAPIGEDDGLPPPSHFMILTALKKKPPEFEDFDDIYYGMGNNEPHFFFSFLSTWNILITSSSSASESMVLSKQPGSEVAWEKWNLEDEGRAELPVHGTDDTFPCGMCLDLTSKVPIPYGENSEIPPSPLFILLSDYGLLTPYMVFNVEPPPGTGYDFVKPPQVLDRSGERLPPPTSSIQGSTPVATGTTQVLQPKVLISSATTVAMTTVNATTAGASLASKILANETFAPSSTFARTFSLDKKPLSFTLPPLSMGGSLPNLPTTSSGPLPTAGNPLLPSLPKPQPIVTTLNLGVQKAPLSTSNITLPPSTITTTTAAAAAKTLLGSFKQPLLSSTPISAASQKITGSGMPSSTVTSMPPPSMPPSRLVSAATTLPTTSTMIPVALQKIASSYAPPTRPLAPSPTLSVTSSVEEENVEKNLIAAIEQEIEEFSEQLQDHYDDIQEAFCSDLDLPDDCLCAIGSEEDRNKLVRGQEKMFTKVNSLLDQTKDLSNMVESMMDEVLECRSLYEEAKDGLRMRKSDHYREYVKKKPLTPLLQNLLDGVHTRYTIAEARVRELSAQIDADVERRKEQETIRVGGAYPPLHTPTYHNVYTTLKNNRRITRLQSTNIDHLVQKMKNMSVLPRAWNFASSTPPTTSQSTEHDKPTRQSQALLNEVKGVMTPEKQAKRKKQPLFSKYSPERLSQFQKLLSSSVQSTSMQTIPLVTSFTCKSFTNSTTTPVPYEEEEDDEVTLSVPQEGIVEPHTLPTFSTNQPIYQLPGNATTLNQLLSQRAPFVNQPSHSTDKLPQGAPQVPEPHHPMSNPPYGLPPLNQVPSDSSQHSNRPQPREDPTGQPFPSQLYVTSVPPPPPPLQPTLQGHDITHHSTAVSATPAMATKTPSEMAAEAAFKRQQSACGASSVVSQSTVVTTTVTNTPVVVITASEMPLSSLFFTGKSQTSTSKPSMTESTMGVHQFGNPTLNHTTSVPGSFQFKFPFQNPSSNVPSFFTSTTGSQSSLTFRLSANNNDKFSMGGSSLFSKSETSFAKPVDSTAPPANGFSSKSESSLFKIAVTTSSAKPISLLSSLSSTKTSGSSISDSLTKPSSGQSKDEETSGEENEPSEDEQDDTLTKPPTDSSSSVATPVLSLDAKSILSGSASTLATPVISTATPIIPATTIKSSVTFLAPSVTTTIPVSMPNILMTKAPPTSVENTVAPPTLSTSAVATSTSIVLSATTLLSSVVSTAAPPTLIEDSLPVTSTVTSTVSEISSATASTSGALPINESAAPPITESTAAPPISEVTALPSTTAVAPPTTTTAADFNPVSVIPPTPLSTAPPTISSSFSIKTSEANSAAVTNPLTLPLPLLRVADKPSDSEGESDVIDNGIDRVASQSSLASNMTDDINIVDDSEGEMEKEPATKETPISQGFTSLFGEKKTSTNSMATVNPFGSSGNVSDNGSSLSTGLHSAHTPSIGSGSGFLAPSKFSQGGLGQSSGLGTGMNIGAAGLLGQTSVGVGQTGMGVGQTGMGIGQTGMGVGQTGMGIGMGAGSNAPALGGPRFGSSPMFPSQPQFGTRPMMGNSMMGATSNARVFGSSLQSDGQSLNFGALATGGGQTFGGIATNQGIGGGTGTGIGGTTKSSFQSWR